LNIFCASANQRAAARRHLKNAAAGCSIPDFAGSRPPRPRCILARSVSLSPGTRLGPYEVVASIGAGGMGEVYRAKDTRLDRFVAIKILPSHLSNNPQLRERFDREARTISQLSHPHICALYDVGHHDGLDYLVMELLEGESLAERLGRGALPLDQIIRLGTEIADALDRAHRQGIVHRDLKPGNIMLTKSGTKLLDFGLARVAAGDASASLSQFTNMPTARHPITQEGTVLGTLQYMAPEQLAGEPTDARTDIFALGAVLYEMATGKRAFEGKSKTSLIAAIVDRDPVAISTLQPLTPPAFEHVVEKCLAKEPEDRWQSAHDVATELRWISEKGSRAGLPAPLLARRKSRERLAWSLAAVAIVAAATLAVLNVVRPRGPAPIVTSSINAPEKWTYAFEEAAAALSPDGRKIAFVARGGEEGKPFLWVRSLESGAAQQLAGTEGACYPFWSPDSRNLGFFADGKLKKIEATGGPAEPLAEASVGRGGAWSRDGVILFAPSTSDGLMRVSASGGDVTSATELNQTSGGTSHRLPVFLPDGRHFLYYAMGNTPEKGNVLLGSLDSPTTKSLLGSDSGVVFAPPGFILSTRERALRAQRFNPEKLRLEGEPFTLVDGIQTNTATALPNVSAAENLISYVLGAAAIPSRLMWLDTAGKEISEAVPEPREYFDPRLSPDGKLLAVVVSPTGWLGDLWVHDLTRQVATRLTFDPANELAPVWSADGRSIFYTNFAGGPGDIFVKLANATGPAQALIKNVRRKVPSACSSDGRFLFYHSLEPRTRWDLHYYSFAEKKSYPFVATEFSEQNAQPSPDGRVVAYVSDESGRNEIYVRPFPTGEGMWQISSAGGSFPAWSPDGRTLYFLSRDQRLMAIPVGSGAAFAAGVPRPLAGTPQPLVSASPGGTARHIVRGQTGLTRNQYGVAPDGKRLLVNQPLSADAGSPSVTLVQNWTEKLRK
jgi:Tol biopolymer transport system component